MASEYGIRGKSPNSTSSSSLKALRTVFSVMASRSADVRIGAPRDTAEFSVIDYEAETGALFVVLAWDEAWTVNKSVDQGATSGSVTVNGPV